MDAFELLFSNISRYTRLNKEKKQLITTLFETVSVNKNSYLIRKGEIMTYDYFVNEGCLRISYNDSRGVETIIRFAPEDFWITDPESFLYNKPTFYNMQAVEDTSLLRINKENFETLGKEISGFQSLLSQRWQNEFISLQQQTLQGPLMSPEEKFKLFILKYPGLVQRLPLWMAAAHLGITPDTLGNLRRKQAATLS